MSPRWLRRVPSAGPRGLRDWAARRVGGAQYLMPVVLFASVVSLDGADKGTLSVNARTLENTFGIGHTAFGLLASVTALTGGAFALPAGVLTDRVTRVRLLGGSILLWAVATALSATASSFTWLVVTRAALGAVTATAGPTVASLIGDTFPVARRAQLYAYVLMGEYLGTGIGLIVTTAVASLGSWRLAVAWPAVPALVLAWSVRRLPEPARGGAVPRGTGPPREGGRRARPSDDDEPTGRDKVRRLVAAHQVSPREEAVLRQDPRHMPVLRAYAYVLRIRTVVIMIVASSLGYFFFAGVRTFAVLFATRQYGISRAGASTLILVSGVGGIAGLYAGGHIADRLLRAGKANGRVLVPVASLLVSPLAIAPAILTTSPFVAVPLLLLGVTALSATNPPLDAARLDVVPSGLWGTSESARTALRTLGELAAPVLFGYLSASVFPGNGLKWTFLVCLGPVCAAGLLGLLTLRTYPCDVATATASDHAIAQGGPGSPEAG